METVEVEVEVKTTLATLLGDPSELSLEELEKRIGALSEEIERCRALVKDKQATRSEAEALFSL